MVFQKVLLYVTLCSSKLIYIYIFLCHTIYYKILSFLVLLQISSSGFWGDLGQLKKKLKKL